MLWRPCMSLSKMTSFYQPRGSRISFSLLINMRYTLANKGLFFTAQNWVIDNIVANFAAGYGIAEEYKYWNAPSHSIHQVHYMYSFQSMQKTKPSSTYKNKHLASLCYIYCYVGEELEELAIQAGFASAKHYDIAGGLMGNLVATRSSRL